MPKVTIDEQEYEIQPIRLSGEDELLEMMETIDRMERPANYAYAQAKNEDIPMPSDPGSRAKVLMNLMPEEFYWGPKKHYEVYQEFVRAVLDRAGVDLNGKIPGDINTCTELGSILLGRLDQKKV